MSARPPRPSVACKTPVPHIAPGTIAGKTLVIPMINNVVERKNTDRLNLAASLAVSALRSSWICSRFS
jgi:hypothetical protein